MAAAPPTGSGCPATMNAERALRGETGHVSVGRSLRSGRVWLLSVIYLMNATVTYGIFLWLPRMLQDAAGPGGIGRACSPPCRSWRR